MNSLVSLPKPGKTTFRPPFALSLILASLLIAACGGGGGSDRAEATPDTSLPASSQSTASAATLDRLATPGAVTDLSAEIACREDVRFQGLARLNWSLSDQSATEHVVQVTIFKDGFETGAFTASKPLPPEQTNFVFEDVQGQAQHRWRVLTAQGDTNIASETARFVGPVCVGDIVTEQPPVGDTP